MPIITLTSDYGISDPYISVLKGLLLSQIENVNLVDISHDIEKFNTPQAAYILRSAYANFPSNTVHLIMVGIKNKDTDFILVKHDNQFFLGLDNGIFSLVFENKPIIAYSISLTAPPELINFPEKFTLVQAAAHLARGGVPEVISEPIQRIAAAINFKPVVNGDVIRASVQYIDSYGNIITNLTRGLFNEHSMDRSVDIRFRTPHTRITKIKNQYSDVEPGDPVAFFNTDDFLEISIHSGKAAGLIGVKIEDTITVTFI